MISASTRQRLAGTVIAGCLLSTALPGGSARAAPSAVTVVMASGGSSAPIYQILVHNGTTSTIDTTVRQELPRGMSPTSVSDGGQTSQPTGQTGGTEISWRLQLPPGGMMTLNTALPATASGVPVSAPACAFAGTGDIPFDCASATWQAAGAKIEEADPAIWQRPAYLFGALAVLVLLLVAGLWWWRRRVRKRVDREGGPGGGPAPDGGPVASRPGSRTPDAATSVGGPPFLDRPPVLDLPPPALARGLARGVARIRPGGDGAEAWPSPRRTPSGAMPPAARPATGRAPVDQTRAGVGTPAAPPPGSTPPAPQDPSSVWAPAPPGGDRERVLSATVPGLPDGVPNTYLATGTPTAPPRAAVPGRVKRRSGPPVWVVVGLATVVVALVAAAAALTATARVSAIDTGKQPTSGAWVGRTSSGAIGATMRDATFEFTLYRVNCGAAVQQPAGPRPAGQRCLATLAARNVSKQPQRWYGASQRAYGPTGNWVTTDEPATRALNGGRDIFAEPVPPSERMLVPIVFTMNGPEAPTRVELRGSVFSAGVSIPVT
ncbi:hypothetical protein BDK92_5052 [Micromonospora pisi]|uniref:DUF4352 domain-containing protein n=1 Tax=Micromonospora pisi TaxID=589240 RepID=A0A495JNZ7_9ACTN|nr:hypothetical protein [Micromonospora pisi]RKR90673.1 hypothetical protein BDK92_5052 [Micromonospora pisi]